MSPKVRYIVPNCRYGSRVIYYFRELLNYAKLGVSLYRFAPCLLGMFAIFASVPKVKRSPLLRSRQSFPVFVAKHP